MLVTVNQISEELRKLMPNAKFAATEAEIAEMAKNVVGTGLGQSTLQKGDNVTEVVGMTVVETKITGNPEPIKYIGLVVNCTTADGRNRQKITSFSGLLRRKPGSTDMHGIFAEDKFKTCTNYNEVFQALKQNDKFRVSDVIRNMEFPGFKASVYETTR